MSTQADPRPLTGEPLPLDLVNTRWSDDDGAYDLLERPDGLAIWLTSAGLAGEVPETPETLNALVATREALFAMLQPTADEQTRELLNETLRHGQIRRVLGTDGPESVIETDSPGWLAAWRAAEHYLRLLEENPARIRKCANPECPLRFYDVSKAGARRWCSMATCGNRAKYRSHYARQHNR
ncbi:CGNR zinc finger domain-containing protein [Paractinoplanes lichenicola]|uniref:CGNR zinc finger domain-containing protein n=1 Tax=Paractinoplanes lichenicola TaxID=2802976 RepID=A0ABS1W2A5_9ACTN|nr:CGNR zinc finger domain-containing protein [Actinoplanes lichenicola]MBL7260844.1 CGNR zinc finger domain-containing protein [Actinoplanes lichenicola]